MATKTLRICKKGHRYYKSSDCPVCPICEKRNKTQKGTFSILATPAQKALENKGIKTLKALSKYSEKEITNLHGMGPYSIPKLKTVLKTNRLSFKKNNPMETSTNNTTDEYIAGFPKGTQKLLKQMRSTIKTSAPEAQEYIGYGMPDYKLNGPLVYFAAFDNHIGFYATPTGHEKFRKELSKYKSGKGSVQLPIDEPLPIGLIEKIVKFRVKENLEKVKGKREK